MSAGSVLTAIGLVVFGYLMGSLSPSVWLGKAVKGIDRARARQRQRRHHQRVPRSGQAGGRRGAGRATSSRASYR